MPILPACEQHQKQAAARLGLAARKDHLLGGGRLLSERYIGPVIVARVPDQISPAFVNRLSIPRASVSARAGQVLVGVNARRQPRAKLFGSSAFSPGLKGRDHSL